MRWLSRRTPQAAPRGRHAAGQTKALQPSIPAEVVPPEGVPDLLPMAEVVPEPVPSSMPILPAGSGVHLGFADGSDHELTPGDPRVGAFRAVARTLAGV